MEHKENKKLDNFIKDKLTPPFNIEYNEAHFEEAMAMLSAANSTKPSKWNVLKLGIILLLTASLMLTYHLCFNKDQTSPALSNKQKLSQSAYLTKFHDSSASAPISVAQPSVTDANLSTVSASSGQISSLIVSTSSDNRNPLSSTLLESKSRITRSIPNNTSKLSEEKPSIQSTKGENQAKVQPLILNKKYASNATLPTKKDSLLMANSTINGHRLHKDSVSSNAEVKKTDLKNTSEPQIFVEKIQTSTMPFTPPTPSIEREFISILPLEPIGLTQTNSPISTDLAIIKTPIPSTPRPRPWRLELVGGVNFNDFSLTPKASYPNTFSRRQVEEPNASSSHFGLHLVHQRGNLQYTTGLNYITQNLNTQYTNQIYTNKTKIDTLHLTKEVLRYVYSYSLNQIVDTFRILVAFDSVRTTKYIDTTTVSNTALLNQTIGISYAEIPLMIGYHLHLTKKISINPNVGLGLGLITNQYGSILNNSLEGFQSIRTSTTILMNLLANIQLDYRLNSRWGLGFSVGSRFSLNPIIHSDNAFQWQIKALSANLHLKYNL